MRLVPEHQTAPIISPSLLQVASELHIANTLHRHFWWYESVLWLEDLPARLRGPARFKVVLAQDDVVPHPPPQPGGAPPPPVSRPSTASPLTASPLTPRHLSDPDPPTRVRPRALAGHQPFHGGSVRQRRGGGGGAGPDAACPAAGGPGGDGALPRPAPSCPPRLTGLHTMLEPLCNGADAPYVRGPRRLGAPKPPMRT